MDNLLKNLVFVDIETVACTGQFKALSIRLQEAWRRKALQLNPECHNIEEFYDEKAAIYAEFGKVIVIGIGFFYENEHKELCLRVKSIASDDERQLLLDFCTLISKGFKPQEVALCAHNGKEFDFPYLCRRMLVNGIKLPDYLCISGKKPWEIKHHDTMELWKFGDRKSYTSLELLASVFDLPSSKQGIDGSMVNKTYYVDQQLDAIADYCKRDVVVLAQLFLKLNCLELPLEQNIQLV